MRQSLYLPVLILASITGCSTEVEPGTSPGPQASEPTSQVAIESWTNDPAKLESLRIKLTASHSSLFNEALSRSTATRDASQEIFPFLPYGDQMTGLLRSRWIETRYVWNSGSREFRHHFDVEKRLIAIESHYEGIVYQAELVRYSEDIVEVIRKNSIDRHLLRNGTVTRSVYAHDQLVQEYAWEHEETQTCLRLVNTTSEHKFAEEYLFTVLPDGTLDRVMNQNGDFVLLRDRRATEEQLIKEFIEQLSTNLQTMLSQTTHFNTHKEAGDWFVPDGVRYIHEWNASLAKPNKNQMIGSKEPVYALLLSYDWGQEWNMGFAPILLFDRHRKNLQPHERTWINLWADAEAVTYPWPTSERQKELEFLLHCRSDRDPDLFIGDSIVQAARRLNSVDWSQYFPVTDDFVVIGMQREGHPPDVIMSLPPKKRRLLKKRGLLGSDEY